MNRRFFLRNTSLVTGSLLVANPLLSLAGHSATSAVRTLSIFHSNDLHGQLSYLDSSFGAAQGLGGLHHIHKTLKGQSGLILDAGNFLDGTAGDDAHRQTIMAMNRAGYQAATLGDQELALGQTRLAALCKTMQFQLVNANYSFGDGPLSAYVRPYVIVRYGDYKVGITGVGMEPDTDLAHHENISYADPYAAVQEVTRHLIAQGCQFVLCLSHLGHVRAGDKPDSKTLASVTSGIDCICGGHGDTFLRGPFILRNADHQEVVLSQGARYGLITRKLTYTLNDTGIKSGFDACNHLPGLPEEQSFHTRFSQILRERAQLRG